MVELGAACLIAAPVACLYAIGAAILGARRADRRLVDSSRRAIYALCALLTVCVVVLEAAFLRSDFSVALVADHSSTTTPTGYKLTAMWSSQGGSLLLWAWVLSIAASGVLYLTRRRHREVVPWATAVLAGIGLFFTCLMLFADGASPFARLDPAPAEGVGLNPLLRHPMMAIHPVMLYSGYVLWSIPFAFAIGALDRAPARRELDPHHPPLRARRLDLPGIGVLLGSRWSYSELGWGGYWGWDAVENASLMPWLVGTAFLHSMMVQEKRGMLKVWNVSLIVATFALALLGTFLVRSGILESIHAFGASTVGGPLLVMIALVVGGSAALIVSRLADLRSERRIESLASREAVFLINNLLLVGLCVVIFWGTFFPLISEAITGERSSLGSPWFDRYTAPLAIVLVLFTGIGPLLAWRRVSAGRCGGWCGAPLAVAVGGDRRDRAAHRRAGGAARPGAVRVRLLRARRARGGVLARGLGPAGAQRRGPAARARAGHRSQPPALRGLHRPRGDRDPVHRRRRVLELPDLRGRPAAPGRLRRGRRLHDHLPRADELHRQRGAAAHVRRRCSRSSATASRWRRSTRRATTTRTTAAEPTVRGFFEGEATSEVGRRTQASGDLWTAMRPDLSSFDEFIEGSDRRIAAAPPRPTGPTRPSSSSCAPTSRGWP